MKIRKNSTIFIIAEAGVNHNGDITIAKKLVDKAKEAGADAIKFQTFQTEDLVLEKAKKAEYQKINTKSEENQKDMLKKLELSKEEFRELFEYCKEKDIIFLSTPFDMGSIEFLESLGVLLFKIPSGEIDNLPYLRRISQCKKPIILSTGMSNYEEIENALNIMKKEIRKEDIVILQCTTDYPANPEDINLKVMEEMKKRFSIEVGLSDHSEGIEISLAAAALGARVIEKHFTLSKDMEGPDHKASLTANEFKSLVIGIRKIEMALGNGIKTSTKMEEKNKQLVRKSIVAKCRIKKGELFTENNITTKRPGDGISPMEWDDIIGSVASKFYEKDQQIERR